MGLGHFFLGGGGIEMPFFGGGGGGLKHKNNNRVRGSIQCKYSMQILQGVPYSIALIMRFEYFLCSM